MSSQPLSQADSFDVHHSTQHVRQSWDSVVNMGKSRSARKKAQQLKKATQVGRREEEEAHNQITAQPVNTEAAPQDGGAVPPATNGTMTPKHEKAEAVSSETGTPFPLLPRP